MDLSQISRTKVFQDCGIDLSPCSPDGQWIVVLPTDHSLSPPKVLLCCWALHSCGVLTAILHATMQISLLSFLNIYVWLISTDVNLLTANWNYG